MLSRDEYLDRQETRAMEALRDATTGVGHELGNAVDLPGFVRRHPVISLGAGLTGGVVVARVLTAGGQRAVKTAMHAVVRPLVGPTLSGLGLAIAGLIVGGPIEGRPGH